jgi:rod shape determining protein RodA
MVIYSTTANSVGLSETLPQIIFGLIGFLALFTLALLDYRALKNLTPLLYAVMIISLLYVLIMGAISHGAARWIDFGFFRFQPSEMAKLVMIIALAKYFSQKGEEMVTFQSFAVSLLYTLIPTVLILLQPDLGTALVLLAVWFGMILASQAKKIHIFGLMLVSFGIMPLVYQFLLKDYQKQRLLTFLNPATDPQGAGYNVLQSTIAVGSGQMFGRGLGHGPQSQLKFLPERYTDFIFSVLAEELGFAGAVILLALFLVLIIRILRVAKIASDGFGSFLSIGVAIWILFQLFVNIGMNIGIMPVTGIPLPLISAGGSSTIAILIGLGILQSIVTRYQRLSFKG